MADQREQVNVLCEIVGLRLEELLGELGVSYRRDGKKLVGPCPVHGGDRPDAFNIYPDGHSFRGNWKCRSRGCHNEFRSTPIGLAWGVLSHQRFGWDKVGDKKVSFMETVKFLCDFIGQPLNKLEVNIEEREKKRFTSQMEVLVKQKPAFEGWAPELIRKRMDIPAGYYIGRGYSRDILNRYDVGLWKGKKDSPITGRIAVPVFDEEYRRVIGITARSVHDKCEKCSLYHPPPSCSSKARATENCKWINNDGFRKEAYLYNYWFARNSITASKSVVLVEGPGDVWRLEEAGINNAVALFGNEITDPQQVVLERSGAERVIMLPHSDMAGTAMVKQVKSELGNSFRIDIYQLPKKDIGEMGVDEVRTLFKEMVK